MSLAAGEALETGDLASVLRVAVQLHQAGRPHDALPLYREALHLEPDHPDALHLSAIVAHQAGRDVEALELIDRALVRLPGFADAHNTRGNLLRVLGRPDDALGAYREAIALAPLSPLAWNNLGSALRELGRPEEALRAYREAIAREPELAEAHLNLGIVLGELGQAPEAQTACEAAVRARPDFGLAHAELGRALRRTGRVAEAIESFRRAVSLEPGLTSTYCHLGAALWEAGLHHEAADALRAALAIDPARPEAHNWMGNVCKSLGYLDQALSAYRQALAERPDYAEAHFNLGLLLADLHRPVEALASYRAALTFRPGLVDAHAHMGRALLRLGRSGEAIPVFRRALELEPGSAGSWDQLGRALFEEGQSDDAARALARAIAIRPDFPEAHWRRALVLLSMGEYEEGWQECEWREQVPELRLQVRHFDVPRWAGGPLDGRRILVHAEQGPADTLFFARYLALVAARGGRVVLECEPELTRLLEALPALTQVIARGDDAPSVDCHVPLESLPGLFRTRAATIPNAIPYLPWETWSGKIPVLPPGEGLRVGVVWNSGERAVAESSLALRSLVPLLQKPGTTWYSLQMGEPGGELARVAEAKDVRDLSPLIRDMTDAAALASQLDLVIAVDSPLAHLAGGLGLPVWTLLGTLPDWRWGTGQGACPWYPTARLFRQARRGDWSNVIEEVGRALESRVQGPD